VNHANAATTTPASHERILSNNMWRRSSIDIILYGGGEA
jgi:hypothetical protein